MSSTEESNKRPKLLAGEKKEAEEMKTTASAALMNVQLLQARWSRQRGECLANNYSNIVSLVHGPLRGGCFVYNEMGDAATLSFCFQYESKSYGLTTGHLAVVGEPVFAFWSGVPVPPKDGSNDALPLYEM
jgi:hypothetical protein